MSYFDPRYYNYNNLSKENKWIVDFMIDEVEQLENVIDDAKYDLEHNCKESYINQANVNCALEYLFEAHDQLTANIIDTMVGLIEGQDGDVEECDTNDYFFGCDRIVDCDENFDEISDEDVKTNEELIIPKKESA